MRVTEQIDAMSTLAVNPFKYLIAPRILATTLTLPILVLVADIIGIYGGYLVSVYALDFAGPVYIQNIFRVSCDTRYRLGSYQGLASLGLSYRSWVAITAITAPAARKVWAPATRTAVVALSCRRARRQLSSHVIICSGLERRMGTKKNQNLCSQSPQTPWPPTGFCAVSILTSPKGNLWSSSAAQAAESRYC